MLLEFKKKTFSDPIYIIDGDEEYMKVQVTCTAANSNVFLKILFENAAFVSCVIFEESAYKNSKTIKYTVEHF